MLENAEEKVNALTKLADVIGKKPLVIWCIVTTFTSGYLFVSNNQLQDKRITENSAGYERLVKELKEVKQIQNETKLKVDSTIPKLDTTIHNVNQTLKTFKRK